MKKAADIQLIGAGFGRTGTDSMRAALEILGFGPCHHMRELYRSKSQKLAWQKFVEYGHGDWDLLLGGYTSCVDWPSAHYWPTLMRDFPKARIILTRRSSESWWTSFDSTILRVLREKEAQTSAPVGNVLLRKHVFKDQPLTKATCIAAYEENTRRVLDTVPAERLLIQDIGSGWAPLCSFLNLPTPDIPYPKSNATAEFVADMDRSDWQSGSSKSG